MRRMAWIGLVMVFMLLPVSRTIAPLPVDAAPLPEETRRLLEKRLSVVEIDREIARIAALREQTQAEIAASRQRLAEQEIAIAVQREKAGEVLRAYYMGRRDFALAALLNARSLPELLRTWEMLDIIVQSDRRTLDRYADQYEILKEGYLLLQQEKDQLAQVEHNLLLQRKRLIALQQDIENALAASGNEAYLRQLMDELEAYWKNVGLFEVRRHFRSLAEAMQRLPAWIQEHPDMLVTRGLSATLTLTDDDLNAFLRSQNDLFNHMAIRFEEERMVVSADTQQMQVVISGHYTLQETPQNALLFHVDNLNFNGLDLPDTTLADLEREFDLGFYPQQLVTFVKATGVKLAPGKLVVELRIG
jgi:hypothetical protein